MKELTKKQEGLLIYLKLQVKSEGYPPSIREMANYFETNIGSIICHLQGLQKKGFIKRTFKIPRGIKILK